jgi:hypothetical protein
MFDQPVNLVNREQKFILKVLFLFRLISKQRNFRNVTSPRGGEQDLASIFEFGCKSTKKCAKSTILNMKVRIRQFKCHQKIPWVRFVGNDISNYGLILNRNGASFWSFFSINFCPKIFLGVNLVSA